MKVDAYFKSMQEASDYIKSNKNKIIVIDESKEDNIFEYDKKNCLFEKYKNECKCEGCKRRRELEMNLVFAKLNMALWDCVLDGLRSVGKESSDTTQKEKKE